MRDLFACVSVAWGEVQDVYLTDSEADAHETAAKASQEGVRVEVWDGTVGRLSSYVCFYERGQKVEEVG